jgi:hypothetical protein
MYCLDAERLDCLLRDLDLTAVVAMRRASPQASLYVSLREDLHRVDVRTDADYQQRLARYIGLRGKLRVHKEAVFAVLEANKAVETPSFADLLLELSDLSGQVEKSVASALLSLLDPHQPVIDRELRELLPRYGFPALAEAPSFDDCVAWQKALHALFAQVISSQRWAAMESRRDGQLPESVCNALSEVRKLNVLLTHARRLVALMPMPRPLSNRSRQPVGIPPASMPVRLHLCR